MSERSEETAASATAADGARERAADWSLSPLDISFLAIDGAATPMNLGALLVLEPRADGSAADAEALVTLLRARAAVVARLRRRLRADWMPVGGASWVPDPGFDVDSHVRLHHTAGQGGRDERDEWAARRMAEPLPRERPLWEIHVLTGLADAATAVLMKTHHAFLDGITAGTISRALADGGSPDALPGPTAEPGPFGVSRILARRMLGPLAGFTDPPAMARSALRSATAAAGVIGSMSRSRAGLPFDTQVGPQRVFTTTAVPLADLRRLRTVHGGTANDLLIGVVAGALRRWLIATHHSVDGLTLRALVPVGRSGAPASGGSGNNFSAFVVDLPVHEPDPVTRARSVAQAMTHHRRVGPDVGAGALAGLTNLFPPAAVRLGGPTIAARASRLFDLLLTTVPAARPLRFDGVTCRELYPLAPLAPSQPLGIGVSAYRGHGYIGITADPIVVPDPDGLAAAVPAELADLLDASGLTPPTAAPPP